VVPPPDDPPLLLAVPPVELPPELVPPVDEPPEDPPDEVELHPPLLVEQPKKQPQFDPAVVVVFSVPAEADAAAIPAAAAINSLTRTKVMISIPPVIRSFRG